jgi:hypothetical protein
VRVRVRVEGEGEGEGEGGRGGKGEGEGVAGRVPSTPSLRTSIIPIAEVGLEANNTFVTFCERGEAQLSATVKRSSQAPHTNVATRHRSDAPQISRSV